MLQDVFEPVLRCILLSQNQPNPAAQGVSTEGIHLPGGLITRKQLCIAGFKILLRPQLSSETHIFAKNAAGRK
jgi:hypothetical protein